MCDNYSTDLKNEYSQEISPSIVGQVSGSSSRDITIDDVGITDMVEDMVRNDYSSSVTLCAAGDILCQSDLLKMGYDADRDAFDFSECFEYVRDIFLSSDYSVATLKTTLAGSGNGEADTFNGYMASSGRYNSPEVLAENIRSSGISLVNIATNHSLDCGGSGIVSTIGFLDDAGVAHVGAAVSSDYPSYYSVTVNDISIGFLGYTNLTNDLKLSANDECVLNTLDDYDENKISELCSEISRMRSENDIVVLMLNFGGITSDSTEPEQRELAERLCMAGADLILGTGSLPLKPMEVIKVSDAGNGTERNCLVFYGLGSLLTDDGYSEGKTDKDISALIDFSIIRNEFDDVYISGFNVTPVYINRTDDIIQPVPVCEAYETSAYSDILDDAAAERIEYSYNNTISALLSGSGLTAEYKNYSYEVTVAGK